MNRVADVGNGGGGKTLLAAPSAHPSSDLAGIDEIDAMLEEALDSDRPAGSPTLALVRAWP